METGWTWGWGGSKEGGGEEEGAFMEGNDMEMGMDVTLKDWEWSLVDYILCTSRCLWYAYAGWQACGPSLRGTSSLPSGSRSIASSLFSRMSALTLSIAIHRRET
jgi:hypothetical protein